MRNGIRHQELGGIIFRRRRLSPPRSSQYFRLHNMRDSSLILSQDVVGAWISEDGAQLDRWQGTLAIKCRIDRQ